MSDPAVIGALIGLALGVVDFVVLGFVRARLPHDDAGRRAGAGAALDFARTAQLVLFPVVGWFVGPVILG